MVIYRFVLCNITVWIQKCNFCYILYRWHR